MSFDKGKLMEGFKKTAGVTSIIGTIGLGAIASMNLAVQHVQHNFDNILFATTTGAMIGLPFVLSIPLGAFFHSKMTNEPSEAPQILKGPLFLSFAAIVMGVTGPPSYLRVAEQLEINKLPQIDGNTPIVETITTTVRERACFGRTSPTTRYIDNNGKQFQVACVPEVK